MRSLTMEVHDPEEGRPLVDAKLVGYIGWKDPIRLAVQAEGGRAGQMLCCAFR